MSRCRVVVVFLLAASSACVGVAEETVEGALEPSPDVTSCETYAAALEDGSVEPDVEGVVAGGELSEWSDAVAIWTSVQTPGDVDEWVFPLRDRPAFALEPWVRIRQSDMIGHAWLEVCARYEGPGEAACFVGSSPSEDGCCRMVDEYGMAEANLSLDDVWHDDGGLLHVTVRSDGRSCGGYWLLVAGARPDDA